MQKSFSQYTVGKSFSTTKPKIESSNNQKGNRLDTLDHVDAVRIDPNETAKELNPAEVAKEPRKQGTTAGTFLLSKRNAQNPLTRATISTKTSRISKRTLLILGGVLLAIIVLVILYVFVPSFQHMAPGNFGDKTDVSFAPFTSLLKSSDVIG